MPQSALKSILTKNFIIVTTISFLVMVIYYQVFVTSVIFVTNYFKLSVASAGFSAGIMVIGCLIGRFFTGSLLSVFSIKKILIIGTLLHCIICLCLFIIDNTYILFAQRFFQGLAVGVIGTATASIMAYSVPYEHHGLGVSLFSLSSAIALAVGPFLGISIVSNFDFSVLFKDIAFLSLIVIVLAFILDKVDFQAFKKGKFLKLSNFIDVRVINFATIAFIVAISYGCISAYLSLFAKQRGLEQAAAYFFIISALITIISRPFVGRIYDKLGENIIIYPTITLTALAMLILAFSHDAVSLFIAAFLNGLGFGNFQSVAQSTALHLVKKYRYTQATSTYFILFDLGIGLGPYLLGFVISSLGYSAMFLIISMITFASAFLYYFVHGKKYSFIKRV